MAPLTHCVLILLIALGWSSAAAAQAGDKALLAARLTDLVNAAGLGDGLGISVADATTGQRLYTLSAQTPRNPASNMKLVTAATALIELGANYRMRTLLAGSIGDDGRVETLVLRGEGDPSLGFEHLVSLASKLADLGVRKVDHIVVDGSYFDDQILPPAFDQQPREVASFRAAVSAVSVDRNAYALRLAPGPAADAPANVILRCPDHFAIESSASTSGSGVAKVYADQKQEGDQLGLKLSGSVPLGVRGVSYERRIESPLPYAGHCLKAALRTQRIAGPMRVRVGAPPSGLPTLAVHESDPVLAVLLPVGKNSDNFYAEMLLKVVGAHASRRPGSSEAGVARAQALLEAAGVEKGAVKMVNGSGLFQGNAIAPDHFVKLLVYVYGNPALRSEFITHLAVGGEDGTLHKRLSDLRRPRIVRAKTGTLDAVVSLGGFVLGPKPEQAVVFSFLANGVSGKQWKARALADDMVRAIVEYLYGK
jgi:D-alanyl-D-alanine carboxypeptidase/D-alanyl-D-alanine-endopeptidase (penicillin-binding protein 4)